MVHRTIPAPPDAAHRVPTRARCLTLLPHAPGRLSAVSSAGSLPLPALTPLGPMSLTPLASDPRRPLRRLDDRGTPRRAARSGWRRTTPRAGLAGALLAGAGGLMAAAGGLAIAAGLCGAGCADGTMAACRVGADCASGMCRADGTCVPFVPDGGRAEGGISDGAATDEDGPDAGAPDGGLVDADVRDDGATDLGSPGDLGAGDGGSRVCTPRDPDVVERAEVTLAPGLYATFRAAEDATVDLAGVTTAGRRQWDLSGALSGDRDVRLDTTAPEGAWWAPSFPAATYAVPLSTTSELLGVFRATDTELQLLGVVSPDDGVTRTRLTYDPPVVVLRFPLRVGAAWSTRSSVTGVANGVGSFYTETYDVQVDAAGDVATPFGSFGAVRARVVLDRTVGVATTRTRTFAFVADCFGTVATVTSRAGETAVEFSRAAEVRRLAP